MSLLFRIVYAAHATGTHHKLALDALRHLRGPDSERWQRLFLKHAEVYMQGSKAPDNEFKDFKNHVLHVRDGYWGGALDKAEKWYGELIETLARGDWEQAVWSAGVLSHYVTDPIQPFHTGQSEAENSIHRAAEWSISKSYNDLRAQGIAEGAPFLVEAGDGAHWLRELVLSGAEKANPHYETLIAHYDLHKGVSDPPAGLDDLSRTLLGGLVVHAAAAFATILDRAFAEAGVEPPEVSLTLDTILAAVKIPAKTLAKRLADAEDRRVVNAMYDELNATGRVDATLPEDDRIVRDLYAKEIEAPRLAQRAAERTAVLTATAQPAAIRKVERAATVAPPPAAAASVAASSATPAPAKAATSIPSESEEDGGSVATPITSSGGVRPQRHYLALADDVERAPTIGPRTAERLAPLGVKTVHDLLAADPDEIAAGLASRHVTAETIVLWQDQCELMLDIPGLRGTHAELLAQAGFRSRADIVAADENDLASDVLAFAATPAGRRLLRDGAPPNIERIKGWLTAATEAQADAAKAA